MKTRLSSFVLSTALVAALAVSALAVSALPVFPSPAFAQDHGGGEGAAARPANQSNWDDAKDVVIWSIVSIAGGCVLLGVFYMLKRRVGGFPANPAWVAPITIMPASELPGDDDAAHAVDDAHATHAPAH